MSKSNAVEAFKSQTMSSLELVKIINDLREDGQAELRHDTFLQKVVKVLGVEVAQNFMGNYKASNGKQNPCYNFPKREAQLMVMSESYKIQAAVYDRMIELEEKQLAIDPMKALSDPATMRMLLLGYTEKVIELESKVEEMQPKVDALDRIATATDGSMCLTDAAKTLQTKPRLLTSMLSSKKWMYKRAGSSHWVAYQDKIQAGYLEHKEHPIKLSDGTDKMTCQVRVTAKGLAKLSSMTL